MILPKVLEPGPSMLVAVVGGVVATLLFTALLYLAPALGLPLVDIPRLIGGIFIDTAEGALWLGCGLFFLGGVLLFPVVLASLWPSLPGKNLGFVGALVKGALWGAILWALTGLILPLLYALNQVAEVDNPGFYALSTGITGGLVLLVMYLAYGLALALITAMPQGINPLDTLGWKDYHYGATRAVAVSPKARKAHGPQAASA